MLRYNNEAHHKTVTGGLISLLMIVSVMIGFSNMIISSMEKTSISSTLQVDKQKDPPSLKMVPGT